MAKAKEKKKVKKTGPKKKDTLQKYDWPLEKRLFFESSFAEVKAYFEQKYQTYNRYISMKTKGWHDEKIAWKKDINEKMLADFAANKKKRLSKMLDKLSTLTERQIDMAMENGFIHSEDLKRLWEMSRTENELPTRIIHNKNEGLNFDPEKTKRGLLEKIKNKLTKK
jgi:hypothetical protein